MKKATAKGASDPAAGAAEEIEARIRETGGWRGETLARLRAIILKAGPEVTESVKWRKPSKGMRGVPVWEHAGILCTGETYKDYVKLTFAMGASLPDPAGLFNASLTGGTRRAIDFREGDVIKDKALTALVRAAVAVNSERAAARPAKARTRRD